MRSGSDLMSDNSVADKLAHRPTVIPGTDRSNELNVLIKETKISLANYQIFFAN